MPWGKFKGRKLKDIPKWYFPFIVKKFHWGTMKPMGEESKALARYIFQNDLHKSQ
jgi:uncharacterized protein (DUF3820 family)